MSSSSTKYLTCAETAKLIRKELKETFPGQKFSVRSSTYSGGASIRVRWTDGPTLDEVKAITRNYEGSDFDPMIDLKSPITKTDKDGNKVRYGADFIFVERSYTRKTFEDAIRYLEANEYPNIDEMVEINDYANDTAWLKLGEDRHQEVARDTVMNYIERRYPFDEDSLDAKFVTELENIVQKAIDDQAESNNVPQEIENGYTFRCPCGSTVNLELTPETWEIDQAIRCGKCGTLFVAIKGVVSEVSVLKQVALSDKALDTRRTFKRQMEEIDEVEEIVGPSIRINRLRPGLYDLFIDNQLWIVEYVTKRDGFAYNEWHCGTENDPHADQFETLREAVRSTIAFMTNGKVLFVPGTSVQQMIKEFDQKKLEAIAEEEIRAAKPDLIEHIKKVQEPQDDGEGWVTCPKCGKIVHPEDCTLEADTCDTCEMDRREKLVGEAIELFKERAKEERERKVLAHEFEDSRDGYRCPRCNKFNKFTTWVYAHSQEKIEHRCDCGAVNTLLEYKVIDTQDDNDDPPPAPPASSDKPRDKERDTDPRKEYREYLYKMMVVRFESASNYIVNHGLSLKAAREAVEAELREMEAMARAWFAECQESGLAAEGSAS